MTMQTRRRISTYRINGLVVLFLMAFPAQSFAQGAPSDPTLLIEPADQTEFVDTTTAIVLSWNAVDLASTYEVQHFFSEPVDGLEPIPLKTKVLTDLSSELLVADLLDLRASLDPEGDSTFHWRVRARNADGEGPWSEVWEFSIVSLDATLPQVTPIPTQTIDEENTLSLSIEATSPAGSALNYSLDQASLDAGISIDPVTGALTWTPSEEQGPGSYGVTVIVVDEDENEASETFTVNVNEVNLPPVLDVIEDQNVDAEANLSFTATASDPDLPANQLTYSLDQASEDAGMTIDTATGEFSWTPTADQAQASFEVTVTVTDDGNPAASDSQSFVIQVGSGGSNNPVIDFVDTQTINEEEAFTFDINATSPTGSVLTYSLDQASLDAGMTINSVTGVLDWMPDESQGPGTFDVTVMAADESDNADTQTFVINVNEVNLPPVLSEIGDQVAETGMLLTVQAEASDADIPANQLTYSLGQVSLDAGMTIDAATGAISWTPSAAQDRTAYDVTVSVTDDGQPAGSDAQVFTINVGDVQAPSIDAIDDMSVNELESVSIEVVASDPNGSTLTYSLDQASLDAGMAVDPQNGAISWTPLEIQGPSSYDIVLTAINAEGFSDSESFVLTVNEVNLAPVIESIGNVTVLAGEMLGLTAVAADADTLAPAPFTLNTLSFTLADTTAAGMAIDPLTGSFTWTSSVPGDYPVTVVVTDDGTPPLSASTSFTVTVDAIGVVTSAAPQTAPFCSAAANFDITWSDVPADEFIVQFSSDPDFSSLISEFTTATTSAKASLFSLSFDQTYYWRVITSLNGQQSEPSPATPFSRWREQIEVAHSLSYPKATEAADFRMISVPGQSTAIPIVSTFSGNQASAGALSPNGDWDWSIWRDNAANATYADYIEQVLSNTSFAPGIGYWAISTSVWQVPQQTIGNAPLDAAESRYFSIPLNQGNGIVDARWTMIGNPFNLPVLWQDLVDENDLTESFDLWDWTGTQYESVSVMQPYKGYYYFNSKNDPSLRMPCILTPVPATETVKASDTPALTLSLHADADAQTPALSQVKVLAIEGAKDGFDKFDRVIPPAYFEKHRVTLVNRNLDRGYPLLAEESRASFEEPQVFEMELKAEPHHAIYLHIAGLDLLKDKEVYLFNEALGQSYDLHLNESILIEPGVNVTGLRLLIGDMDFIQTEEANLLPDDFKLQQSFPNPFVHQTNIEYALPEAERVTLEIYNLLGQRVRTLVDGDQGAGYHRIIWDGNSDAGDPVASGVYMYVFNSSAHHATKRVVRVR